MLKKIKLAQTNKICFRDHGLFGMRYTTVQKIGVSKIFLQD